MILVTAVLVLVRSAPSFALCKRIVRSKAIHRKNSKPKESGRSFRLFIPTNPRTFSKKISWVEADINDLPALKLAFENVTPCLSLCCL